MIVDGQQLDPQLQLLHSIRRRQSVPGLVEPTVAAGRARYRRETRAFRGPVTEVDAVRDLEIAGAGRPLRARHYAPVDGQAAPLTVYFHGGGFVIGDLDTHDEPCRMLCRQGIGTFIFAALLTPAGLSAHRACCLSVPRGPQRTNDERAGTSVRGYIVP